MLVKYIFKYSGKHSLSAVPYIRLKRARGHLQRVITMMEEQQPCVDTAQQLYAVERAVKRAKETLIRDHIDNCLETVLENDGNSKKALAEFKEISKYL